GLANHAVGTLGGRRQDHLGAEETHQLPALDREALRHGDDERIALGGADHGEADAGVAARRFDPGLSGLQFTGPLGCLDDAQRQPILDRTEGIERFDLDVEVDPGRRQPVDPDYWRVADCSEDAVILHRMPSSSVEGGAYSPDMAGDK